MKYSELKNRMRELKKNDTLNVVFINGNKNYVDIINKNIEKYLKDFRKQSEKQSNKKDEKVNIKIINCFEVGDFNLNMQEILHSHDKILNTSGERKINEVFEGYA